MGFMETDRQFKVTHVDMQISCGELHDYYVLIVALLRPLLMTFTCVSFPALCLPHLLVFVQSGAFLRRRHLRLVSRVLVVFQSSVSCRSSWFVCGFTPALALLVFCGSPSWFHTCLQFVKRL